MDLREITYEGVDSIHLSQETDQSWAILNSVINLRVP